MPCPRRSDRASAEWPARQALGAAVLSDYALYAAAPGAFSCSVFALSPLARAYGEPGVCKRFRNATAFSHLVQHVREWRRSCFTDVDSEGRGGGFSAAPSLPPGWLASAPAAQPVRRPAALRPRPQPLRQAARSFAAVGSLRDASVLLSFSRAGASTQRVGPPAHFLPDARCVAGALRKAGSPQGERRVRGVLTEPPLGRRRVVRARVAATVTIANLGLGPCGSCPLNPECTGVGVTVPCDSGRSRKGTRSRLPCRMLSEHGWEQPGAGGLGPERQRCFRPAGHSELLASGRPGARHLRGPRGPGSSVCEGVSRPPAAMRHTPASLCTPAARAVGDLRARHPDAWSPADAGQCLAQRARPAAAAR